MISINDTHPAPKAPPTYRVRTEAMAAAVFTLGPNARHGFEYTTVKCDGRWVWKPTDEVRPDTPAEIKANGGKKSLIAMAAEIASAPMAHVEAAKPAKLPVPPRRVPSQAPAKAAGASGGGTGAEQPPSDDKPPSLVITPTEGTFAAGDKITYPDGSEGRIIGTMTMPACNGLDVAPQRDSMRKTEGNSDPLDIPGFLKRESTPEAKEKAANAMKRIAKQVGPNRVIANPPDAKAAAKRVEKAKAAEAKFEGTPAHARQKAKEKTLAKAKADSPKAAKRASEPRTKTAGHFSEFATKAALIKVGIGKGHDDDKIVADVNRDFPGCNYQAKDIKWYRRKMEKAKA